MIAQSESQFLGHGPSRIRELIKGVLKDQAHVSGQIGNGRTGYIPVLDSDASLGFAYEIVWNQTDQGVAQGRFARPVCSDDAEEAALFDAETHPLQGGPIGITVSEGEVLHSYDLGHARPPHWMAKVIMPARERQASIRASTRKTVNRMVITVSLRRQTTSR